MSNTLFATEAELKETLDKLKSRRFDITKKPKYENAAFQIKDRIDNVYRVGNFGHLGVVTGPFGSRKTTVVLSIIASAIKDDFVLNMKMEMQGKNILFIDTEQPEDTHYEVMEKVHDLAELDKSENCDRLYAYNLKPFPYRERLKMADILIKNTPNLGLVVIDGIVDMINSINDEIASREMTDRIAEWTDTLEPMLITVIHTNKDGVNERGFIGGFLADKANWIIKTVHSDSEGKKETTVFCRKSRYGMFPSYGISHNDQGLPILASDKLPV